jgi:hypothetical protein
MRNRPRFTRSGQTLTLTYPMADLLVSDRPIGGGEDSAAGVPSRYTVARHPLVQLRLRVLETEWPDLVAFLRAVDAGIAFTWHPDTLEATSYSVYLESPSVAQGESFAPEGRDEGDGSVLLVPVTLRRTTTTAWNVRLY